MILASKIFLEAIGCLKGAQEAPDLPLAVAPDRNWIWTSWGPSRGSKSTPHAFSSLGAPVGECNFLLPFSWCNLEPPKSVNSKRRSLPFHWLLIQQKLWYLQIHSYWISSRNGMSKLTIKKYGSILMWCLVKRNTRRYHSGIFTKTQKIVH